MEGDLIVSRRILVGVLTAALAAGTAVTAATAADAAAPAPDTLHQQAAAIVGTGITGVLAESTDAGRHRYATAGVGNTKTGAPVPVNGEFRAGSTTKTFIATVVLQLAGEGRLSLDNTVGHWLPGVVSGNGNDGSRITVRELLQHTSGIYNYVQDIPAQQSTAGFEANRLRTYTAAELVAIAMRHKPNFAPGTAFSYSNTNYVLAGMIIDRVTGHSWESEVQSRIIKPLGLRHTFTPGTSAFIPGPHAEGYSNFGAGPTIDVTVWNPSATDASGAILSTTGDLTRFYSALIGGHLLRQAQLAAMEQTIPAPEFEAVEPGTRYGLGLVSLPLSCGGIAYGHAGDTNGYHTRVAVTPDGRRVAVLSATGDGDTNTGLNSYHAMDALLDQQLCGH